MASQVHPNFYFSRFLQVIVSNHDAFVQISKPEGLIHFYNLGCKLVEYGYQFTLGLALWSFPAVAWRGKRIYRFNGCLRKSILANITDQYIFQKIVANVNNPVLLPRILVYVVLLCVLLALSTPNLGTLSRYRVGFLPFFVFVIAYGNPLINFLKKRLHL
jgi:hypothetical protein